MAPMRRRAARSVLKYVMKVCMERSEEYAMLLDDGRWRSWGIRLVKLLLNKSFPFIGELF